MTPLPSSGGTGELPGVVGELDEELSEVLEGASSQAGADGATGVRLGGVQMLLIFTLVGLVFVVPTWLQYTTAGEPVPYATLVSELIGWYLWALFVPPVIFFARRFPLRRSNWRRRLLLYFGVGLVVSAIYAVLDVLKTTVLVFLLSGRPAPPLLKLSTGYLFGGLEFYLLVYAVILAVVHAFEYHRRYQDRQLTTQVLEAQLTRSQLQVLRAQLNPHFLFNTLNAISALMHRDVDAADRMIVLLSDFLRQSLDSGDQQEIPLDQELLLLERYLEIEKARFGDRLTVDIEVEEEVLDAMVPNLILQPLVENAIRHGISKRSAPGEISVRGRSQFPDRLELRVQDDGPGFKGDPATLMKPGVGLDNTRARLVQLYGEDAHFEIGNAREGGFEILLSFPLRTDEAERDLQAPVLSTFGVGEG